MLRILLLAVAYWVAHRLGYLLRVPPGNLALVWPAAGVAFGGLLITERHERWKLALALAAANLLAGIQANVALGFSPFVAVGFLAASALEAAIAVLVFSVAWPGRATLDTVGQVGALVFAAVFGAGVSAIAGASVQSAMFGRSFQTSFVGWWSSDGLSLLLVAPAVIALAGAASAYSARGRWSQWAESALFLTIWTASAWEVFHVGRLGPHLPMPYLLVALLTWAAVRLDSGALATALCVLTVIIANSPLIGFGPSPLGGSDPRTRMLLTQLFLGVSASTGLLLFASRRETAGALATAREERERVESLADNLPGGIVFQVEVGEDGTPRFRYVSAGIWDITGLTADEVRAAPGRLLDLVHPEDVARVGFMTRQPGPGAAAGRNELRLTRLDGEMRWVSVSYSPGRGDRGRSGWEGIFVDVSEQRRSQEALRQSEARLLEAQKQQLVGQLAGGVAHDFNNLLTIILGYADELMTGPGGRTVHEPARLIAEAASRASSLTQQLLAFGRRAVLSPVTLDLNAVVRKLAPIVQHSVGEAITVHLSLSPAALPLRVDAMQLERACLNLALNARDAMPAGGTLTIRTGEVVLSEDQARVHDMVSRECVWVAMQDTGTGMPPEVRARLFEPFFTTKPFGSGTGMGLAAVHGVVRQSRGFIDVDTAPGQGSTFTVYFPRHRGEYDWAETIGTAAPRRDAATVLVEDADGR